MFKVIKWTLIVILIFLIVNFIYAGVAIFQKGGPLLMMSKTDREKISDRHMHIRRSYGIEMHIIMTSIVVILIAFAAHHRSRHFTM